MAKSEIVLCDSTLLISHFRGDPKASAQLQKLGKERATFSIITHAEIYYGARNREEFEYYKRFFNSFKSYLVDEAACKVFNGLLLNYALSHKVRIADMLIAATSIANNLQLFTDNRKDFDFIPEIRFYDP